MDINHIARMMYAQARVKDYLRLDDEQAWQAICSEELKDLRPICLDLLLRVKQMIEDAEPHCDPGRWAVESVRPPSEARRPHQPPDD